MAATNLYFFIWYVLCFTPWCHAARSEGSAVLGSQPPERLHLEEPREVYLTFFRRTDIKVPTKNSPMLISATIELAHDKTVRDSTTQLYIGRLRNRPQIITPVMAERGAIMHNHAHAEIGRPVHHSQKLISITYRLGTTTKKNIDIINPHTGAGLWVDALTPIPQISPRNTFVNIWKKLIGKLMMLDSIMDNTHFHPDNILHSRAINSHWEEMDADQNLRQDFSWFPVPMVVHQQTGPPHPYDWLEGDVMYNVLNLNQPFRIEASPNHANAWSIIHHVDEVEYITHNRRVNNPGEDSVTGPRRPGHGN